jgi:2-polyprenyl-3-methyl-5-hydroxy-6-metoxy-1,4-benzoquinol methylase
MASDCTCPACGRSDLELFAPRERVSAELRLRQRFFRERIDGRLDEAEKKDSADPTRGGTAEIFICRDCDILVRRDANASPWQDDTYAPFAMERMLRAHIRAYRRKAARYRPLLPRGSRIVEVGSYVGGFLHVAREWGWNAIGVDVGRDTSHFARAHGYVTREEPLEKCRFDAQSFDGVFIWNCFEQIAHPKSLLTEVRRILKPGGMLVIRVPNANFYRSTHDLTLLGHSNLLGFPHLYGFTAASLNNLLHLCGFTAIDHWTAPHIDPGIRPLTATARQEAVRLTPALRRSWIEAVFLHAPAGMPEKTTIQRARKDKRQGKAASTQAGEFVREEMEHIRRGKHGARSTKQAIAIGLSKARRAGVDLAPPKSGPARKSAQNALQERGRKPSARRSKAVRGALKREGHSAASRRALSKQAHRAARRRSAKSRHNAAVKAARTRKRHSH